MSNGYFDRQNEIEEEDSQMELQKFYSRKNIIPIKKDGILYFFKVSLKQPEFDRLKEKYRNELMNVELKIDEINKIERYVPRRLLMDDITLRIYLKIYNYNYAGHFKILKKRSFTPKELKSFINLTEEGKKAFINDFAETVRVKIPIDDECWQEVCRKENFDEIINRFSKMIDVYECGYESKIYKIMNSIDGNFNLSFIASVVYEFIENDSLGLGYTLVIDNAMYEGLGYDFNKKEETLPVDLKYEIIKSIYEALKIECVYSKKIDEIESFEYENMLGSKKLLINLARRNHDILYKGEFSKIYKRITSKQTFCDDAKELSEEKAVSLNKSHKNTSKN